LKPAFTLLSYLYFFFCSTVCFHCNLQWYEHTPQAAVANLLSMLVLNQISVNYF